MRVSIDFMALNFSDKKTGRELPDGLFPVADPYSEAEIPVVETTFEFWGHQQVWKGNKVET